MSYGLPPQAFMRCYWNEVNRVFSILPPSLQVIQSRLKYSHDCVCTHTTSVFTASLPSNMNLALGKTTEREREREKWKESWKESASPARKSFILRLLLPKHQMRYEPLLLRIWGERKRLRHSLNIVKDIWLLGVRKQRLFGWERCKTTKWSEGKVGRNRARINHATT